MSRPPLPPFTRETAAQKARMAEDAWNSRDPDRVALAYTEDSRWRNRSEFFQGRAAIVENVGPMFQIMFTDQPAIRDYREFCRFVDRGAFQKFVLSVFPMGVYASPSAALHSIVTLAHTEEDVDKTIEAASKALETGG